MLPCPSSTKNVGVPTTPQREASASPTLSFTFRCSTDGLCFQVTLKPVDFGFADQADAAIVGVEFDDGWLSGGELGFEFAHRGERVARSAQISIDYYDCQDNQDGESVFFDEAL